MKRFFAGLIILLSILVSCSQEDKLSKPIEQSIESELFRLEVVVPAALLEEGETIKVSSSLTYLGDEPIELEHGKPAITVSFAGQDGGREDIAIITDMASGDIISLQDSIVLPKAGTYSLKIYTTILKVNGEYVEGAGYENLKKPHPRFQEQYESQLSLEPLEITVERNKVKFTDGQTKGDLHCI